MIEIIYIILFWSKSKLRFKPCLKSPIEHDEIMNLLMFTWCYVGYVGHLAGLCFAPNRLFTAVTRRNHYDSMLVMCVCLFLVIDSEINTIMSLQYTFIQL